MSRERLRLLWYALMVPLVAQDSLEQELAEVGHYVTHYSADELAREPWHLQRLRALLRQAATRNIWTETAAWAWKIWAGTMDPAGARGQDTAGTAFQGNPAAVLRAMDERSSVRLFDASPVPDDVLSAVLRSAIQAPSSCNRQPVRFLVVTDTPEIEYLSGARGSNYLRQAKALILVLCDLRRYRETGLERAYSPYLDAGAAIENMLLAATACELGSCWVNCGQDEIAEGVRRQVYKRFGIGPELLWAGMVALGYALRAVPKPPRNPLEYYLLDGAPAASQRDISQEAAASR